MSVVDLLVLIGIIAGLVVFGLVRRSASHSPQDYFLAGRALQWWQIGFSLFATNFSAAAIIGLTGAAYLTGIAIYNYEWVGILVMVVFAVVFARSVRGSNIFTIAQYLEERYDRRIKIAYSAFILFLLVVIDMAGSLYAGGMLLREVFPSVSINVIIFAIMATAGTYSILGGMGAITRIDTVQSLVLIIGASLVCFYTLQAAGGWAPVVENAPGDSLSLIRPVDDRAVPWTGLVFGVPIVCAYFWLANQNMVQWVLSAKTEQDARNGLLMAGFLKLLILFIIIIPGVAAAALFPNLSEPDRIYPTLLFELLPVGVLGLVLAGFVTAIMSSADSILHASATLITMDFVKPARPHYSPKALVRVGRITTLIVILLSAIWAPMIANFGTLFEYVQGLLSYAVAPFVVVYLAGWLWPRANARGAAWGLGFGLAAAVSVGLATATSMLDIHYLHLPLPLSLITLIGLIMGSLSRPAAAVDPRLQVTEIPRFKNWEIGLIAALIGLVAVQVLAFW